MRAVRRRFSILLVAIIAAACGGGGGGGSSGSSTLLVSPSVVAINDATVTEGVAGNGTFLTMTNAAGVACRVTLTTADVSASSPADYTAISGQTIDILGSASLAVPLTIANDTLVEDNETFTITIALAAGSDPRCQLGRSVAVITIQSDDVPSVVSIADALVNESAGGEARITMTNFAGRTCVLTATTANGTAIAPGDYAPFNARVELTNVAGVSIPINPVNDVDVEPNETFTVTISIAPGSDAGCRIGRAVATITITSEDVTPSVISIADATITEGAATAQTTISMTNFAGVTCIVSATSANGSAIAPADYAPVIGKVVSLIGAPSAPLNFSIVDDLFVEPNESFTVTLDLLAGSDARCQIGRPTATITIVSDDVASVVSIANTTVNEGAPAALTVSRTNPGPFSCALRASTTSGTATAPADFTAKSAEAFVVPVNAPSATLPLDIVDDALFEPAETFTVTLSLDPSADPRCQLGNATATVTIISNDAASVLSIADASVVEGGTAQTTISMTNPTIGIVCLVTVTTEDGTAAAPGDYPAITGGAPLGINVASTPIGIQTTQDLAVEPNETFTVRLALAAGSHQNCQLGASTATITIIDDDAPSVITVGNVSATEASGLASVPVAMTNPAGRSCAIVATTSNGVAIAPDDFVALAAAPFVITGATGSVGVTLKTDALAEPSEDFTVTIALQVGADSHCQIGTPATATVTILNSP